MATKALKKAFILNGVQFYFVILKNPKKDPKEPFLYLITNLDLAAKAIGDIQLALENRPRSSTEGSIVLSISKQMVFN